MYSPDNWLQFMESETKEMDPSLIPDHLNNTTPKGVKLCLLFNFVKLIYTLIA